MKKKGIHWSRPLQKPPAYRRQSGVALVIGLIVLLLLTLLGVSAIRSTTLEEHMAGNLADRSSAFQAAEAALHAGADKLANNAAPNCAGFYSFGCGGAIAKPRWQNVDWNNNAQVFEYTLFGKAPNPITAAPVARLNGILTAHYIVSRLPPSSGSGGGIVIGGNGRSAPRPVYRITAYATGPSGKAEVELQTTYQP